MLDELDRQVSGYGRRDEHLFGPGHQRPPAANGAGRRARRTRRRGSVPGRRRRRGAARRTPVGAPEPGTTTPHGWRSPVPAAPRDPRTSSSRCGPTSVTPRSSSSSRRRPISSSSSVTSSPRSRTSARQVPGGLVAADATLPSRGLRPARRRSPHSAWPRAAAARRPARAGPRAARHRCGPGASPTPPRCRGRSRCGGRSAPAAGGLEQAVALLEHPVVVAAHPGEARLPGHQQLVEEAAPLPRVALDQRQVVGREQHGPQDPEHLAGPWHGAAVQPPAVGPARVDLELDQRLPVRLGDRRTDDRLVGTERAPAAGRSRPGGTTGWRRSRSPRPGWSCLDRWGRRTPTPRPRGRPRPAGRSGSRSATDGRRYT